MGKNQHVTPHTDGGWQVIGAGNQKATLKTNTQAEAIAAAREIARNQKSEVYSLRWHYPNQVIRVRATQPNLSPLQARAPLWFCFQLWFIILLTIQIFKKCFYCLQCAQVS